ncbi:hypothetical protein CHUAL_008304 [Chamberlinius hualienensis]
MLLNMKTTVTIMWIAALSIGCSIHIIAGRVIVPRSLPEFGKLIYHITGRQPLQFNNYGNYCGIGGSGHPVDQLDRCCQVHDKCYDRLRSSGCFPYVSHYKTIAFGRSANCVKTGKYCADGACDCDLAAATCFAMSPYDRSRKSY